MFQKTVAILMLAALSCVGESAVVPTNQEVQNEYTLLGKYTPPAPAASTEIETQQGTHATSYYFLSQNAAGWSTAANDCRNNLGDTASLVYIETAAELQEVSNFIHNSDDTGSTYWTGGRYDSDSGKFVWDNGVEIIAAVPWDQGHPNTQTPLTKVLAYTAGGLSLRTDFQTVSLRYICELVV